MSDHTGPVELLLLEGQYKLIDILTIHLHPSLCVSRNTINDWKMLQGIIFLFVCLSASRGKIFEVSQWRHNERDGVSSHRWIDSLLNRLFRRKSKKASKLRVIGLWNRWPLDSPHQGPVTRKMFPFDDVIVVKQYGLCIQFGYYLPSIFLFFT